jgi:Tfp pilus assembly protein FimV
VFDRTGGRSVPTTELSVVAVRHLPTNDEALLPQELTMSTMILTPTRAPRIERRPASRPAVRRTTVRLTRRGRAVVFLLGLVVALVTGFMLAAGSTATERPEQTSVIQVGPGETLWDIARGVAPSGHTAQMVEHIKELNHLPGGALQAGQDLRVPLAR